MVWQDLTLEAFRQAQVGRLGREFSNFVEDDRGAAAQFLDLACDTFASLPEGHLHRRVTFRADAGSAFNLACREENPELLALPAPLQARWIAWRQVWQGLKDRNPRLDLVDMLQMISESHDASSWVHKIEDMIEDWAMDDVIPMPFEDCHGIATPAFRARLRALRGMIDGWVCWVEAQGRVVFLADADWLVRKAKMQKDRAEIHERIAQFWAVAAGFAAKASDS